MTISTFHIKSRYSRCFFLFSVNLLHLSTSVNSHQDIILHNKTGQSFTGIFFQKEMYRKEKTLGKAAYL